MKLYGFPEGTGICLLYHVDHRPTVVTGEAVTPSVLDWCYDFKVFIALVFNIFFKFSQLLVSSKVDFITCNYLWTLGQLRIEF